MNRIVLTTPDIVYVFGWRDRHQDLVRSCPNTMSSLRIECKDKGIVIVGSRKLDSLLLRVYVNGKPAGEIRYAFILNGKAVITQDTTKVFVKDDKESMLSLWCSLMALFAYGDGEVQEQEEETERKPRPNGNKRPTKPTKRSTEAVTYIILRKGTTRKQGGHRGSHAKKQGVFSVRGHFRHYKSGKVVWIAEFVKGEGKEKPRTYMLGKKGDQ